MSLPTPLKQQSSRTVKVPQPISSSVQSNRVTHSPKESPSVGSTPKHRSLGPRRSILKRRKSVINVAVQPFPSSSSFLTSPWKDEFEDENYNFVQEQEFDEEEEEQQTSFQFLAMRVKTRREKLMLLQEKAALKRERELFEQEKRSRMEQQQFQQFPIKQSTLARSPSMEVMPPTPRLMPLTNFPRIRKKSIHVQDRRELWITPVPTAAQVSWGSNDALSPWMAK